MWQHPSVTEGHRSVAITRRYVGVILVLITTAIGGCGGPTPVDVHSRIVPQSTADFRSQLPTFGPPPAPQRITLRREPGRAAWTLRIPTEQPVAFLTVDDGEIKDPDSIKVLEQSGVPLTIFLTVNFVADFPEFFATMARRGGVVEAHTMTHPHLPSLSYADQEAELCDSADQLADWYGRRPLYFRPPYGEQNDDTLRAAWDCRLKVGFGWTASVQDGVLRFRSKAQTKINPGDIILMHFRDGYPQDFIAAVNAIKRAGLTPALLEDYVDVTGVDGGIDPRRPNGIAAR
jgi:peptidoglycan/xylan/chitin deacetylase (PgdA/CDA1 family)